VVDEGDGEVEAEEDGDEVEEKESGHWQKPLCALEYHRENADSPYLERYNHRTLEERRKDGP